ncbi:MAG: carboxypeptidase-like regulatory domain-containing protein [Cryomorphaceae bacterium]|nr:carboxypeptidase-like regulatory domain-containing protein [Cryomorphaceae bacterium]
MKFALLPFLILATCAQLLAQRATISGYVEDAQSRERLVGVNVFISDSRIGTVTNAFGFFSLTVPTDTQTINFSYVGYMRESQTLALQKDTFITVVLNEGDLELSAVDVVGEKNTAQKTQMSTIDLNIKESKKVPALFGEVDILRVMQLMPGVQSGNEGSVGLYVRGGGPDQNLILLDGVPIYNVSHLFGFFSVFNADAIKSASIIKGGFPARYGGRLSSVIDITMKEGDMRKFRGEGSIGLIASKLTLEGPIVKDKTSFMISGRRTYIDALAQPFIASQEPGARAGYYFGDLNIKVNHKFSDKDRLYASYFYNVDKFYFRGREGNGEVRGNLNWGNSTGSLRWNHLYNSRLFMNVSATYTRYQFGTSFRSIEPDFDLTVGLRSNIEDYGAKADFEYIPNNKNHIRFGANIIHHQFRPSTAQLNEKTSGFSLDSIYNLSPVLQSQEAYLYAENDHEITDRLMANYGLHYGMYLFEEKFYHSLQPRLSFRYLLNDRSALKISYARMQQFLHLLSSNNGIGLPSDLWVPATNVIPPMMADQLALGYVINSRNNKYEFSTEIFYKKMTDLIEFRGGSSFINPNDWQTRVETGGIGWVYGMEVFVQKKLGDFTGWVGYTWMKNDRQFENLNNGKVFPYRFDRRHDISIVANYEITKKIDVSCTWVYGTGIATNIPIYQTGVAEPPNTGQSFFGGVDHYGDLNSFRFAPYHRGDVSINFHKKKKKFERTWNISVYNVYNRRNPFFIYRNREFGQSTFRQVSLFPILPSISYRVKF